ncbi:MAG: bifunctional nuclease family protein, partial [Paramuribaculum sp.]|nr:bifunctional nuclease family protein [Paramuribaculum sp.]
MENRVRLRVMGLSYNQLQSGAYALILAQVGGPYRIPVVIGPAEAQSIAMKIEGVTPPRPLTHD